MRQLSPNALGSLYMTIGSLGYVVNDAFIRRTTDTPALSIAFVTAVALAALTGPLSLLTGWHGFTTGSGLFLTASVCSLVFGYLFTIQTVRVGDLSVSAPFRYSILVGAVVIGYLLFGEVPDRFTVIGSLVIVATGLYAVHLERTNRPATISRRTV